MAFCKQCSLEIFGEDRGELSGLRGPDNVHVLCEGCGITTVTLDGECIFHTSEDHSLKVFAPCLYVTIEKDGEEDQYFHATDDVNKRPLALIGEPVRVGIYKLVGVRTLTGEVRRKGKAEKA